jgi:hypothetical protein
MSFFSVVFVFAVGVTVGFIVALMLSPSCPDPPQPPPRTPEAYTFDEMMAAVIRDADAHLHDLDRRSPFSQTRTKSRNSIHTTNAKGTDHDHT